MLLDNKSEPVALEPFKQLNTLATTAEETIGISNTEAVFSISGKIALASSSMF
jgi:hypothetical protein